MAKEHFHVFSKEIKDKDIIHYDVCILGGGPAGLTAALYSGRYGLKTLVIAKQTGGTANLAEKIENYPGFIGSGMELMKKIKEQAEKFSEILSLDVREIVKNKFFIIKTEKQEFKAKSLIIALGTEKKKLGIKGEDKFLGRGISYCATCDANFFRNKNVAVIGGGNSASRTALLLAGIAKKVYVVYHGESLKCDIIEKKKLKKENVEIICGYKPAEVKGKEVVESLVIENGKRRELEVDGVFVEIGSVPLTELIRPLGLKLDENDYIIVDEEMKTNIPGVFAAGDIIKSKLKQVVVAAAQGAIAAKSAYDYVKNP